MGNFVIFDTETTGLLKPRTAPLSHQPRIIEIGVLLCDDTGVVLEEFNQLIDPQCDIPEFITKITGIKSSDLVGKPVWSQVLPAIEGMFRQADVCMAHNAAFDVGMVNNEMLRMARKDFPWPEAVICTVQEYSSNYGRRPRLTELYEKIVGKPLAQTHRALDDVKALHEIIVKDGFMAKMGTV